MSKRNTIALMVAFASIANAQVPPGYGGPAPRMGLATPRAPFAPFGYYPGGPGFIGGGPGFRPGFGGGMGGGMVGGVPGGPGFGGPGMMNGGGPVGGPAMGMNPNGFYGPAGAGAGPGGAPYYGPGGGPGMAGVGAPGAQGQGAPPPPNPAFAGGSPGSMGGQPGGAMAGQPGGAMGGQPGVGPGVAGQPGGAMGGQGYGPGGPNYTGNGQPNQQGGGQPFQGGVLGTGQGLQGNPQQQQQQQGNQQQAPGLLQVLNDMSNSLNGMVRILDRVAIQYPAAQTMLASELLFQPAPDYAPLLQNLMFQNQVTDVRTARVNYAYWPRELKKAVDQLRMQWQALQQAATKQQQLESSYAVVKTMQQLEMAYSRAIATMFLTCEFVKRAYVISDSKKFTVAASAYIQDLYGQSVAMYQRGYALHSSREMLEFFQIDTRNGHVTFEESYAVSYSITLSKSWQDSVQIYMTESMRSAIDIAAYLSPLEYEALVAQGQQQNMQQPRAAQQIAQYPGSQPIEIDVRLSQSVESLNRSVSDPELIAKLRGLLNTLEGGGQVQQQPQGGQAVGAQGGAVVQGGGSRNYLYNRQQPVQGGQAAAAQGGQAAPAQNQAQNKNPTANPVQPLRYSNQPLPEFIANSTEAQSLMYELQTLWHTPEIQNRPALANSLGDIISRYCPRPVNPVPPSPPPSDDVQQLPEDPDSNDSNVRPSSSGTQNRGRVRSASYGRRS